MKKTAIALLLLFGFNIAAFGQDGMSDFIRYQQGRTQQDGALQIAVTQYADINSRTVTLYGVVHIADEAYYRSVQKDLDKFDSVLYEGVGPQPGQQQPQLKPPPGAIDISVIQKLFADGLGFQFQKDGIDYTKPNLVHADMTMAQLQRALGGKQLNPLEQYMPRGQNGGFDLSQITPLLQEGGKLLGQLAEIMPEIKQALANIRIRVKLQMAQQLANADMSTMMDPEMYQAIVVERDKIVIQVLQRQLRQHPNKKNIAIFYGAAHNPDLQQRLQKLGFRETNKRWVTAWTIGNGVPTQPERSKGAKKASKKKTAKKKAPARAY